MSALGDVIVDALEELLRVLFSPITRWIQDYGNELLKLIVSTPHPDAVFARPTNEAWPAIYDYYWETMVPLALFLWALAIGLVIFFETTSHLFSSYHRSKLKKRSFTGLLGILSWWWIAALALRFTDALTGFIVPSLSDISLFQTLSFSALGVLGLVITLGADLVLFVLIAMIYFVRQIVLYLFVLFMPILIAFWIPGVGPFTLVSGFVHKLAGFLVPFLVMTLPVAVLFRLADLLGTSADLSNMGGFGAWLTALVIPIVALAAPFVLFWQAGSLMSVTERTARHASRERAVHRSTGGQNFYRGASGKLPVGFTEDDDSIPPRAHRAGSRVRSAGTRLHGAVRSSPSDSTEGGVRANGGATGSETSNAGESRANDFGNLRLRARTRPSGRTRTSGDSDENHIPYYQ